jgi:hypothetical protein
VRVAGRGSGPGARRGRRGRRRRRRPTLRDDPRRPGARGRRAGCIGGSDADAEPAADVARPNPVSAASRARDEGAASSGSGAALPRVAVPPRPAPPAAVRCQQSLSDDRLAANARRDDVLRHTRGPRRGAACQQDRQQSGGEAHDEYHAWTLGHLATSRTLRASMWRWLRFRAVGRRGSPPCSATRSSA